MRLPAGLCLVVFACMLVTTVNAKSKKELREGGEGKRIRHKVNHMSFTHFEKKQDDVMSWKLLLVRYEENQSANVDFPGFVFIRIC